MPGRCIPQCSRVWGLDSLSQKVEYLHPRLCMTLLVEHYHRHTEQSKQTNRACSNMNRKVGYCILPRLGVSQRLDTLYHLCKEDTSHKTQRHEIRPLAQQRRKRRQGRNREEESSNRLFMFNIPGASFLSSSRHITVLCLTPLPHARGHAGNSLACHAKESAYWNQIVANNSSNSR